MTQQVWQIAAGENGRYYDQLFIDHDIMFLGPGRVGEFPFSYEQSVKDKLITQDEYNRIDTFVNDIKDHDVILLRRGREVRAIGLTVAGYQYYEQLDDIYGWDLQHVRRVCWQPQLSGALQGLRFGASQMRTVTRVYEKSIRDKVNPLIRKCIYKHPHELLSLPPAPSIPMTWDEVKLELYHRGQRYDAAERTINVLQQIARLSDWYDDQCQKLSRPTEHEVVAHMVIPLLISLGWSEQQLAVEWRRIDLATFVVMPPVNTNCVLVCEAKGRGQGMQNAIDQADKYVKKHGLTNCRRILVTNGTHYYLYDPQGDNPVGYFNVHSLRTNHIAPTGTNAIDTIIALTPAGIYNSIPKSTPPAATITAAVPMIKKMVGG